MTSYSGCAPADGAALDRFGDQIYSEANRTLMSYTQGVMKKGKEKGLKKEVCTRSLAFSDFV